MNRFGFCAERSTWALMNNSNVIAATRYASLTDEKLYCLFTEKSWRTMDFNQRLDALQEIEIRMAAKQRRRPCRVRCEPKPAGSQGCFDGNEIVLNDSLLRESKSLFKSMSGKGIAALDTVIHEGRHAFQRAVVAGKTDVKVSPDLRRLWAFNTAMYISTGSNKDPAMFCLYAFQPLERDAREFAGRELANIYRCVMRATGKSDPMFEKGIADLRKEKYIEYLLSSKCVKKELLDQIKQASSILIRERLSKGVYCYYMGEVISMKDCFEQAGIKESMFDGLLDAQTKDVRDIIDGKKSIDDYMDGLDGKAFSEALDAKLDGMRKKTLDEIAGMVLKSKPDLPGVQDGSGVRIDGKKKVF